MLFIKYILPACLCRLKSELESQLDFKEAKLKELQCEKKQIEEDFRNKLKDIEKQNLKETERLKELHRYELEMCRCIRLLPLLILLLFKQRCQWLFCITDI